MSTRTIVERFESHVEIQILLQILPRLEIAFGSRVDVEAFSILFRSGVETIPWHFRVHVRVSLEVVSARLDDVCLLRLFDSRFDDVETL